MQQLLAGMHEHGWNYTIHSACRGWELTQRNWQDRGIAIDAHSKIGQKPGAQGCLWSHMDLWELCASSNRDMIILESDALCVRPWDPRITSERLLKIAYKFQATRPNKRTGTWSAGSAGYLLNPQHASRLLGYVRATSALEVDKLIGTTVVDWQHGPRLFDINTMGYSNSSTKAASLKQYKTGIKY
jgi:GR25 family glycosyltransferase involved in LPS biosynthesis